jgi:outer membrane lipoprotein-sorting protein
MFRQAFSIVFLLSLNGAASAQTALSPEELVARNIAARGGIERIKAVHTMSAGGTVLLPNGMEMPVTMYVKRPGLMRMETAFQGKSLVFAFDGTDSWSINPFKGSGEPEKGSDAESMRLREAMFDGDLVDYQEKGSQLEFVGTEDVQGRPAYKLKLTTKHGTVSYICLDLETFLEAKIFKIRSQDGGQSVQEAYPTGYKPVAGVMFAHSIEVKKDGVAMKIVLENVKANVDLEDSLFLFPASRIEQP